MFQMVAVGCGRMVLASWVEQPPEASDFCFGRSQSILNHVRQSQSPKSIHVGMVPFKVNSYWIMSVKVKVKVNQYCFRYLKVNPYSGIGHIHCGKLSCAILLTIFIFVQVAEYMKIYLFQAAPQICLLSKLWNLQDRILHSWLVVKVSRRRKDKFWNFGCFGAHLFCVTKVSGQYRFTII